MYRVTSRGLAETKAGKFPFHREAGKITSRVKKKNRIPTKAEKVASLNSALFVIKIFTNTLKAHTHTYKTAACYAHERL